MPDLGAICVKEKRKFLPTNLFNKQKIKIPFVRRAAKDQIRSETSQSALVEGFFQKKFSFFSKKIPS
ncbi:hypothetical protein OA86_10790 [Kaistella jeonii]|uniref:Uncharacterized protein n=1 Tax=Kaistella jeonii TaxID=266749 RepID=A0A0C1FKP3_9FLAO|nr:hypothetical protein OA86_10790 [Kaistella jeonii]